MNGFPQHQGIFSVEIVGDLKHSSISEVKVWLKGAICQHLVFPLGKNQEAITACRHNLSTNRTTVTAILRLQLMLQRENLHIFVIFT